MEVQLPFAMWVHQDLALCEGTLLLESRQLHHIIWPELTWISAVEKN